MDFIKGLGSQLMDKAEKGMDKISKLQDEYNAMKT